MRSPSHTIKPTYVSNGDAADQAAGDVSRDIQASVSRRALIIPMPAQISTTTDPDEIAASEPAPTGYWRLSLLCDGMETHTFITARPDVMAAAVMLLENAADPELRAHDWEMQIHPDDGILLDGPLGDGLVKNAAILSPKGA